MKSYWVYIVQCADDSFYTGVSSKPDQRIAAHNFGIDPRAYTYTRRPVTLVYSQEFSDPNEAIAAEKKLKGWSRAKKIALVAGDWDEIRGWPSFDKLRMTRDKLRMTRDKLRMTYDKLRMTYDKLRMTYDKLRMTYDKVRMTYDKLRMTERLLTMISRRAQPMAVGPRRGSR